MSIRKKIISTVIHIMYRKHNIYNVKELSEHELDIWADGYDAGVTDERLWFKNAR